jgi:hypothetical protein
VLCAHLVLYCTTGVEVPFELLLLSSHPLELCELPRQCTVQHKGSWGDDTCGGSNLHSSWLHNPAYTLQLERKTLCRCGLLIPVGKISRVQESRVCAAAPVFAGRALQTQLVLPELHAAPVCVRHSAASLNIQKHQSIDT